MILYICIRKVRLSGVRASVTISDNQKFDKMYQNIVEFRPFIGIAKGLLLFQKIQKIDSLPFESRILVKM